MHFPRDQLLVLVFDDLQRDPVGYGRELLEFIGSSRAACPRSPPTRSLGWPDRAAASPPGWSRERDAVRWAGLPGVVTRVKGGALPRALNREYGADEYRRCGRRRARSCPATSQPM